MKNEVRLKLSVNAASRHLESAVAMVNAEKQDPTKMEHQIIHNAANQAMEAARELYRLAGLLEAESK